MKKTTVLGVVALLALGLGAALASAPPQMACCTNPGNPGMACCAHNPSMECCKPKPAGG